MNFLKGEFYIPIQISLDIVKDPSGKGLAQCDTPLDQFSA